MQHLSSSVIAVQHGDLAVVAPWLDITQRLSSRRCFCFTVVEGRLGLPIEETPSGPVLQELARDVAVIETQHTEDVSDYANRNKTRQHPPNNILEILDDSAESFCDYVLVSVNQTRYKLLMRVSSHSHSRMVDPSVAMLKVATKVYPVTCDHKKNLTGTVPEPWNVELHTFDELLGRWGDTTKKETVSTESSPQPPDAHLGRQQQSSHGILNHESAPSSIPQLVFEKQGERKHTQIARVLRISHLLNTDFKYNTALALTNDDLVFVSRGNICLPCSLQAAVTLEPTDGTSHYPRWVIVKSPTSRREVPARRRGGTGEDKGMLETRTVKRLKII
jgi:hypothetical protein